jgi:DNA-binding response OmpR family regulator
VTVSHDGTDGLRAAERHAIDIIVLDVMLPFMDGLEVTYNNLEVFIRSG